jgi:CubicO group peptidase (beta-lactamase class C family)
MDPKILVRWLVSIVVGLTAHGSSFGAADAACPPRASWPSAAGFPRRTEETARLFPDRVRALEEYMFTLHGADGDREGIRTDAVLVVHQGAVFYERYARGYGKDSPHLAWSVTKTITQLLAGIAVAEGAVRIDDSICTHLKSAPSDRCDLTIKNLLEFGSGIDFAEDYEGSGSRQDSSVIAMLYGEGRKDMARFVLEQRRTDPPGTAWRYSTGDTTLLASVIDEAMRPRHGEDYPWTILFDPLGLKEMTFERDGAGHHIGGAYSYAPPEDWARLGYFMLNDGCWNGARLLPEGWLASATVPSEPFLRKRAVDEPNEENGRQLWLNKTIPGIRDPRPWPAMPEDAFTAWGHWGQFILVVPSKDLIVVRAGDDRDDKNLDRNRFFKLALELTGQE